MTHPKLWFSFIVVNKYSWQCMHKKETLQLITNGAFCESGVGISLFDLELLDYGSGHKPWLLLTPLQTVFAPLRVQYRKSELFQPKIKVQRSAKWITSKAPCHRNRPGESRPDRGCGSFNVDQIAIKSFHTSRWVDVWLMFG